jgi:drug/metabolite transporter (DMT)-like permease
MGQYLTYEGLRRAPASLLAPLEYTGLLWSFLLTRLVWGETPAPAVFAAAGLILLAGAITVARAAVPRNPASP